MEHRFCLRQRLVDRCVDAEAGALDFPLAAFHRSVIDADLHEGRGRYLRPVHPERDLVIAVAAARHHEGQMIEDAFTETVHESQPVRGRQIDARLTFVRTVIPERLRRNPGLHERPPAWPLDGGLAGSSASVAQIAGEPACIAAGLPSGLAACAL